MNKPKRGRPPGSMKQSEIDDSRVEISQDRDEVAHSAKRPPRQPMGATLNLEFPGLCDDKDYHYRVFDDKPGRIDQAIRGWWEHVKDHQGNNVSRTGFKSQFLMKIEKKYWDQDQELKQKKISGMLRDSTQKLADGEYLPDDRHHALQKDDYDPLA